MQEILKDMNYSQRPVSGAGSICTLDKVEQIRRGAENAVAYRLPECSNP